MASCCIPLKLVKHWTQRERDQLLIKKLVSIRHLPEDPDMGVSINGGTSKWMV